MTSGSNPFGPRALANSYAKHRRPSDREVIKDRIFKKAGGGENGSGAVELWEVADEDWIAGKISERDFVEATVNLMEHSEAREPLPDLPDLSPVTNDPNFGT